MATMHCVEDATEWDSGNTDRDTRLCWMCGQPGDYGYWHNRGGNLPLVGSATYNAARAEAEEAAA